MLNLGGADIQSGAIVFDYAVGADPAATIESLLAASCDGGLWDVGQFRDSTAATTGLTLGCFDDTAAHQVKVMATYPGDFNLDGVVDILDRAIWFANAFTGTPGSRGTSTMTARWTVWIATSGFRTWACRSLPTGCPPPLPSRRCPNRARWLLATSLLGLLACARQVKRRRQDARVSHPSKTESTRPNHCRFRRLDPGTTARRLGKCANRSGVLRLLSVLVSESQPLSRTPHQSTR